MTLEAIILLGVDVIIKQAVEIEREACAQICKTLERVTDEDFAKKTVAEAANRIRGRSDAN